MDDEVWVRAVGLSCSHHAYWTCSFRNVWEFWAYNVISGLFQAPYYAFSQTMMAELTPPGFDNMVRLTSYVHLHSAASDGGPSM